jgi:hypothetical protein
MLTTQRGRFRRGWKPRNAATFVEGRGDGCALLGREVAQNEIVKTRRHTANERQIFFLARGLLCGVRGPLRVIGGGGGGLYTTTCKGREAQAFGAGEGTGHGQPSRHVKAKKGGQRAKKSVRGVAGDGGWVIAWRGGSRLVVWPPKHAQIRVQMEGRRGVVVGGGAAHQKGACVGEERDKSHSGRGDREAVSVAPNMGRATAGGPKNKGSHKRWRLACPRREIRTVGGHIIEGETRILCQ